MSAVIVILSDSDDDCVRQQPHDVITITPSEPSRPRSSANAISSSSSGGRSIKSHSAANRSPVVIVPGTPPTPFAPEPIAPSLPLRHIVGGSAVAVDDLNCR
jgi:hypothetical protein